MRTSSYHPMMAHWPQPAAPQESSASPGFSSVMSHILNSVINTRRFIKVLLGGLLDLRRRWDAVLTS